MYARMLASRRSATCVWVQPIRRCTCLSALHCVIQSDDPLSSGSSHSIQAAGQDHFLLFSDQLQNHAAKNGVRAAKVANRIATYHVLSDPLLRCKCRSFAMFQRLIG